MKQIPYGIADFEAIIKEDCYYVDKTMFIPKLEKRGHFILLMRPRRFGKSMFSNMLAEYYDIASNNKFQDLFGNLWIGNNPTPLANTHLVLKLDFSRVGGYSTIEELMAKFREYVKTKVTLFVEKYSFAFNDKEKTIITNAANSTQMVDTMVQIAHMNGQRVYLFVDEYDNFTNKVLAARGVEQHKMITHGEGFYRDFFQGCKGTFDRIFMTGVTPVTYDDLTSGFGIADNISLSPQYHNMIGVSETELREMIEYYRSEGCITRSTDEIVNEMRPYYDNYCFAKEAYQKEPTMYNTNMVMQYMREIIICDKTPTEMIDKSARVDYDKLDYLVMTDELADRERRIDVIQEICSRGYTTGLINSQFPAAMAGDERNFKSMLYYFGTLTYDGIDMEETGAPRLRIPNLTMRELYLEYMLRVAETQGLNYTRRRQKVDNAIFKAAIKGDWHPLVDIVGELYHDYSSIRNAIKGEADIQGFMRGLLCLNQFYQIWPEIELGKGYCDVLLVPHARKDCMTRHSYLIEIKYMKANEKDSASYVTQAREQLGVYASEPRLKALLKDTDLTLLYMVFQQQSVVEVGTIERN